MNFEVHNWGTQVNHVTITAISSSSVFLIGDNEEITLSSFFDTPPGSYVFASIIPLGQKEE